MTKSDSYCAFEDVVDPFEVLAVFELRLKCSLSQIELVMQAARSSVTVKIVW